MKIKKQERGCVAEVRDTSIDVQSISDNTNFIIPRRMVKEGSGILHVPGFRYDRGWHGTVIHYEGGLYGFQPDSGIE